MKHYFTSDFHLHHQHALLMDARRQFASVEEMDQCIMDGILSTLKRGDVLYFCGDLVWKTNQANYRAFFDTIKRHGISFYWCLGNHDKLFSASGCIRAVRQIIDVRVHDQDITLCHYPMTVWNKSHYGAWNLHGHIHVGDATSHLYQPRGKQLNVNLEYHNFLPIEFDEVAAIMATREDNFDLIDQSIRR
jgi:calcineurin-like phosphoesterase family protein